MASAPPGSSGEGEQLSPWILNVSAAPTLARPGLRGGAEGRGQRQGEGGEEAARALPAKAGAGIHGAPGPHGHSRRALQAGPPDPPPRLSRLALISVRIVSKAKKTVFGAALSPPGKDSKLCCAWDREGPGGTAAAARPGAAIITIKHEKLITARPKDLL